MNPDKTDISGDNQNPELLSHQRERVPHLRSTLSRPPEFRQIFSINSYKNVCIFL